MHEYIHPPQGGLGTTPAGLLKRGHAAMYLTHRVLAPACLLKYRILPDYIRNDVEPAQLMLGRCWSVGIRMDKNGVMWQEVDKLSVGEMAELLEHEIWMQKVPRQMQQVGRSNLILTTK